MAPTPRAGQEPGQPRFTEGTGRNLTLIRKAKDPLQFLSATEAELARHLARYPLLLRSHFRQIAYDFRDDIEENLRQLKVEVSGTSSVMVKFADLVSSLDYRNPKHAYERLGFVFQVATDTAVRRRYGPSRAHMFEVECEPGVLIHGIIEAPIDPYLIDVGFFCKIVCDGELVECKLSAFAWHRRDSAEAVSKARALQRLSTALQSADLGLVSVSIVSLDSPTNAAEASRLIGFPRVLSAHSTVDWLSSESSGHDHL